MSLLTLWSNFFDWLRLFDRTSFLIKLVGKTFVDVVEFMILFMIALAMIGSAMYALEYSQGPVHENQVIEPVFDFFFLNMIYNQYMLALGEFSIDGFAEHPNYTMCYFLFIFATLFTQIVFLNMLIAIMGNTFDSVMEKKHQYAQETKLHFMSDYYGVFNPEKGRKVDTKTVMYIVSPQLSSE